MLPDEPNDEERQEQLPEDGETPFRPADPNPSTMGNTTDPIVQSDNQPELDTTHPATDSNIDSTELYDEGVAGAAEVEDQSGQTAVTGYDPDNDMASDEISEDEAL